MLNRSVYAAGGLPHCSSAVAGYLVSAHCTPLSVNPVNKYSIPNGKVTRVTHDTKIESHPVWGR
jgi:hypothetical protein